MIISLILGLILGAVAVIFALQNITVITVAFLAWQIHGSLALILILAVLAGIIISLLISIPEVIRSSFTISSLRKQNKKLAEDLEEVKRQPAQPAQVTVARTTVVQADNSSV